LAGHEGVLEIDDRLLADLIGAAQKVLTALRTSS
jgi:hypothetical protein